MKKILLTVLSVFTLLFMQAGSLELYFNGSLVSHGSTVQVIGDPSAEVIQAVVNVKNTSAAALDVKCKKIIHEGDTLALTVNTFCWDLCFPPFTYVSPNYVTIQSGQTVEKFYGDYNPLTVVGISRVTYVFFDMNNTNDSTAVTVEYNASPAGVADLSKGVKFSESYPNPATSVVNVDYALTGNINGAKVVISNMLGSRVKEISLTEQSGKIQIPVSDLMNGIYFYSLVGNDQVILTRKFIVKR